MTFYIFDGIVSDFSDRMIINAIASFACLCIFLLIVIELVCKVYISRPPTGYAVEEKQNGVHKSNMEGNCDNSILFLDLHRIFSLHMMTFHTRMCSCENFVLCHM